MDVANSYIKNHSNINININISIKMWRLAADRSLKTRDLYQFACVGLRVEWRRSREVQGEW